MELIDGMAEFEAIRAEEMNGTNVTGVEGGPCRCSAHDCGPTRPPSAWPLTDQQRERLEAMIAQLGIRFD